MRTRSSGLIIYLLLASSSDGFSSLFSTSVKHAYPTSALFSSTNMGSDDVSSKSEKPLECAKEAMRRVRILQEQQVNNSSCTLAMKRSDIRVGPSSIAGAGSGVFATQNIKSGTLIGFYPVHCIGVERFDTNAVVTGTPEDQEFFFFDDDDDEDDDDEGSNEQGNDASGINRNHNYLHYLVGSRPLCGWKASLDGSALYIDVNPNRQVLDTWISHFINGAIVESNSEQGVLDYYGLSRKRKNCVHIPFGPAPILATVTTKNVKKGDELFTTYGGSYWLDDAIQISDDDDDDDEEEPVEITYNIELEAKQTAQDILTAMLQARVAYATLETDLEQLFISV